MSKRFVYFTFLLSLLVSIKLNAATAEDIIVSKEITSKETTSKEAGHRNTELDLPGSLFKDCDVCPEMVVIPAGQFQMGSNRHNEKPVHTVTIAKPFAMAKTEVTFAEYDAFAQATNRALAGDDGWGRGSRPVINVDWEGATAYAGWLSDKTGKVYRLPSESEWEYAARAGSTTKYSWGDSINCSQARYGHHSDYSGDCGNERKTAVVGSFSANPFGLQDMHGNVYEWTQDCWNASYSGAPASGSAWTSGDCSRRVLRSGSWGFEPDYLRSAYRSGVIASFRGNFGGFRLAQDL
ncbi:MAG: formylglycine-generating enzyme family protein [Candidatus Azotimanducaceae bacterium WSBS_2022_MAG_OTU7]